MATNINLRIPSKYAPAPKSPPPASSSPAQDSPSGFTNPPLEWLQRTWTVTHSTLAMWCTARNVRITYKALPPSPPAAGGSRPRVDDMVEYEKASGKGGLKTVAGIDTACGQADTGSWDWRGKGLLGFVTSHWEILGWGEREVDGKGTERWAVTWFAPTLFTKEGVDLYSDRREGMSEALAGEVLAALKGLGAQEIVDMVEKDMKEVQIQLPWKEN